jgi:cytochrome c-type biogenesis protein CcmH
MLASLSPTDPRRGPFQAQIDRVAGGGPIEEAAPSASPEGGGAAVFIRSMVASLAAKLASHPDDPDGWARLVRSYGVLHDRTAQGDALARARKRFAARPDLLRPIEAEARDHPA